MDAAFDELYVLSDLHIGGHKPRRASNPDLRIFDAHAMLRDALIHLARRASDTRRVGVVLNGDVFDFLAQAGVQPAEAPRYFYPEEAARWVFSIAADFPEVFEGLRAVVRTPGATLVIVVGNHDLELALPAVQARLREVLGDGELRFHTDGAGFRAQVGPAAVLCTHGERSDTWNAVDHDRLRKVARAQRDGVALEAWRPTPGHGMVIDVLNPVKVKYPFVDLFQPQDDRVIALYRWVDPELDAYRGSILRLGLAAGNVKLKLLDGGAEDELALPPEPSVPAAQILEQWAVRRVDVERDRPGRPLDPVELVDEGALLGDGPVGKLRALLTPATWTDQLYQWLLAWADDHRALEPHTEDDCSTWARATVGADVTYVVCGHTHQRKHIRWPGGRAYFNSGTWIPLLTIPRAALEDPEPLRQRLRSRDRKELEPLIRRVPTVVRFLADGTGALCDVVRDEAGAIQVTPVVDQDGKPEVSP